MDAADKRDQALNLADFKIDDILSTPGDRLLAEVGEDFGDPALLAAEFDSIAASLLSGRDVSAADPGEVAATSAVQRTAAGVASLRASSAMSPATPWPFRQAALAAAERLAVPWRSRAFLGAFATLLLLAVLAPGIYPRLVERPADRTAVPSGDDLPARPQASASATLPQVSSPLPAGSADPSLPAAAPVPPPLPPLAPGAVVSAEKMRFEAAAARARRDAADSLASNRQAPPPRASALVPAPSPQTAAAPEPPAFPSAAARVQEQLPSVAQPRRAETGGFVVQLSTWRNEAQAQSTFRALKSKYAVLKDRDPLVRRMDEGRRGVSYALQVGPFESEGEAEQFCARLKAAGGVCSVGRN